LPVKTTGPVGWPVGEPPSGSTLIANVVAASAEGSSRPSLSAGMREAAVRRPSDCGAWRPPIRLGL
jgi:hypothetical protein